jgi:hypothetical protein
MSLSEDQSKLNSHDWDCGFFVSPPRKKCKKCSFSVEIISLTKGKPKINNIPFGVEILSCDEMVVKDIIE